MHAKSLGAAESLELTVIQYSRDFVLKSRLQLAIATPCRRRPPARTSRPAAPVKEPRSCSTLTLDEAWRQRGGQYGRTGALSHMSWSTRADPVPVSPVTSTVLLKGGNHVHLLPKALDHDSINQQSSARLKSHAIPASPPLHGILAKTGHLAGYIRATFESTQKGGNRRSRNDRQWGHATAIQQRTHAVRNSRLPYGSVGAPHRAPRLAPCVVIGFLFPVLVFSHSVTPRTSTPVLELVETAV